MLRYLWLASLISSSSRKCNCQNCCSCNNRRDNEKVEQEKEPEEVNGIILIIPILILISLLFIFNPSTNKGLENNIKRSGEAFEKALYNVDIP